MYQGPKEKKTLFSELMTIDSDTKLNLMKCTDEKSEPDGRSEGTACKEHFNMKYPLD